MALPFNTSIVFRGPSAGPAAPSFFSARGFGRYVATRFFPAADLHGHRPAVLTRSRLSALSAPVAPYARLRFFPPCASCLPARAHSARCCPRVRSSRPSSSALPRVSRSRLLSCGTFPREPATRLFDGSFAPTPTSRDRFARQAPSEPLTGFPPSSLAPGVVHSLSGHTACATFWVSIWVSIWLYYYFPPNPPRSPLFRSSCSPPSWRSACARAALLGPCFKTGRVPPVRVPRFRYCFASFHSAPALLFSFPSRYFSSIGLRLLFSLRCFAPPLRRALPSTPTLSFFIFHGRFTLFAELPLLLSFFLSYSTLPPVRCGLFPFRSPLLRESVFVSFPLRTGMLASPRFSHSSCPFCYFFFLSPPLRLSSFAQPRGPQYNYYYFC